MTVNALGFYAVALLIVLAAAGSVGLTSLRLSGYAGAATLVLIAVLDLLSGAYSLAFVEIVVPGIAAAVVYLVLNRDAYRGLGTASTARSRWWIGGPIALLIGVFLLVTLSFVGAGWFPEANAPALPSGSGAALLTVLHYRAPYAIAIAAVLVAVAVAAGLVIGRRSADEQTLDQHIESKREREERARRRRDDREQGRRRPAKVDP